MILTGALVVHGADAHSQAAAPTKAPPLAIIDVHTHTGFSGTRSTVSGIAQTAEQFFKEWRAAGIVGAVSHDGDADPGGIKLRDPRVIHCAGARPPIDTTTLAEHLSAGTYRCIKVYLGYVHAYAYDPLYEPVYRLAERFDVPVVFHTGDPNSTRAKLKYADPLTIDEVAVDYPNVRFVIAHCGNPWIQSAAEVAYKNPNVYLECSAMLTGAMNEQAAPQVKTFVIDPIAWVFGYLENPEKLMFGSDWPLVDMPSYVAAYKRAIPREHWRAVFHDNAVRVFRLSSARP